MKLVTTIRFSKGVGSHRGTCSKLTPIPLAQISGRLPGGSTHRQYTAPPLESGTSEGWRHSSWQNNRATVFWLCKMDQFHRFGVNSERGWRVFSFSIAAASPSLFDQRQLRHRNRRSGSLEPVMNFPAGGAGSQFFSVRGVRSDEYGLSSSDA